MKITPWVMGRGRSGSSIAESLTELSMMKPELGMASIRWIPRETGLTSSILDSENPVLCIANPHGLHAQTILNAVQLGIKNIICEKPACTILDELHALRSLDASIAILHVYRQMWGPQFLKQMIDRNELGEIITIEGRYWKNSTAEAALQQRPHTADGWKNDAHLSGPYDTYLDIATHWIDIVAFLFGETPERIQCWMSYKNAPAPHRDSHVQLTLNFPEQKRAFGSISKIVHGAINNLEINVLGTQASATWHFLRPDEIEMSTGKSIQVISRPSCMQISPQRLPPESRSREGYINILAEALGEMFLGKPGNYPRLEEHLNMLEKMFTADILQSH